MKQILVGVSKQSWSVIPFLGVNRQDIDMRAKKATQAERTNATARKRQIYRTQSSSSPQKFVGSHLRVMMVEFSGYLVTALGFKLQPA